MELPRLLVVIGVIFIAVGLLWMLGERIGLGRLPGDIVWERGNVKVYFLIVTSNVISVVLSLILWLMNR